MRFLFLLLLLGLPFVLPSCSLSFDPATGRPSVSADPVAVAEIADAVAERVNNRLVEATK